MRYSKLLLLHAIAFLFYINSNAQNNFLKIDEWMNNNSNEMGGRCYLMIYKDGKIVYSKAASNMNMRQKFKQKESSSNKANQ